MEAEHVFAGVAAIVVIVLIIVALTTRKSSCCSPCSRRCALAPSRGKPEEEEGWVGEKVWEKEESAIPTCPAPPPCPAPSAIQTWAAACARNPTCAANAITPWRPCTAWTSRIDRVTLTQSRDYPTIFEGRIRFSQPLRLNDIKAINLRGLSPIATAIRQASRYMYCDMYLGVPIANNDPRLQNPSGVVGIMQRALLGAIDLGSAHPDQRIMARTTSEDQLVITQGPMPIHSLVATRELQVILVVIVGPTDMPIPVVRGLKDIQIASTACAPSS